MSAARAAALVVGLALVALAGVACTQKESDVSESTSSTSAEAPSPVVLASAIPVAHTPAGGYGTTMPPPVLTTCTEPLAAGAADLRGMWKAVVVEVGGQPAPAGHKAYGHVERIEQCGDRIVITAGGVVHDMRCDGTVENGVHDVAEADYTTPISVVCTFENGVHTLRPAGLPVEVKRHLDGDQLVWEYLGFTARLERVGPPEMTPPT